MKIMMVTSLPYEPAFGGANKANRRIAEILASRSNIVCALTLSNSQLTPRVKCASAPSMTNGVSRLCIGSVDVHEVSGPIVMLRDHFAKEVRAFGPDYILLSSEDSTQVLLAEAVTYNPSRVIYLAHTPNCLPFGPDSFYRSQKAASLLREVKAVVAVSKFCAEYIRSWSTIDPVQIYLPVYGSLPFPSYLNYSRGYITLVNPCRYKGIDIFLELARSFPTLHFAGVVSWGTTVADLERMSQLKNIVILQPDPDIDVILQQTSVLLVPSLYLENFPMIIIESMLRGIPVMASNVGGIPEAKMNTGYIIDVQPISAYTQIWDDRGLWIPIVPEQNCEPWRRALTELQSNSILYERESINGRATAAGFVSSLSIEPLELLMQKSPLG